MKKKMEKLGIPPVGEFLEMISDSGGKLYACKLAMDMFDIVLSIRKILLASDLSENSARATEYACLLMGQFGAELRPHWPMTDSTIFRINDAVRSKSVLVLLCVDTA